MGQDLVVVGGINTDFVIRGRELPGAGQSRPGERLWIFAGGKGANQAAVAAHLGVRVSLIGCVGADERGEGLIRHLAQRGVDVGGVKKTADSPTGAVLVQIDARGRSQRMAARGANGYLVLVPQDEEEIRRARVVSVQLTPPPETVERTLRAARQSGVLTVFEPSPWREFPPEWLRLVDLVRANAEEAGALSGIEVRDRASARRAAEVLVRAGAGTVALQAGDEGNLVLSGGREVFTPRIDLEPADTSGAGDTYTAVLAAELVRGADPLRAAPLANAAAALATLSLGAQESLPDRAAIEKLIASQAPSGHGRGGDRSLPE